MPHILEGRSLQALLHGQAVYWRNYCVSEYDYSTREARRPVNVDQQDARIVMVFDGRWKYTHVEHMRPMLFDLENDPNEFHDLGADPSYADEIARLGQLHFEWTRKHHNRITRSAAVVEAMTDRKEPPGIMIGYVNKEELEQQGRALPSHVKR